MVGTEFVVALVPNRAKDSCSHLLVCRRAQRVRSL